MNRYIVIRRLRFPAFLLLVGTLALLNQADILSWGKSWPFFLILAGVMALAERAALAAEGGYPPAPYPGAPYAGAVDPNVPGGPIPQGTSSAIVPAHSQEYEKEPEGGQS
jgi:hypothetical protein